MDWTLIASLIGIIWIDLLLSGDNAVVIALVCRTLPAAQQRVGLVLGAVGAIVLRLLMAGAASFLLGVSGLRILGGIALLVIAAKLVLGEDGDDDEKPAAGTLCAAVTAIAIADASMSLDNVMAVAALAKGNYALLVAGIVLAIPFVIGGAAVIKAVVDQFPWMVWLGAALLGYVAVSLMIEDPLLADLMTRFPAVQISTGMIAAALGAIGVVAVGLFGKLREHPGA
jgi:YjbE family integral membrane protein